MLFVIAAVLLFLWLIGALGSVGGSLIHLLLVIALIVVILHFINGRRVD